ncbi:MAG: hypothetical protein IJ857_02260 [Lachnospiraceae bacterium]|nr:hypothetical protein [Lachnospiraceae bacterium]
MGLEDRLVKDQQNTVKRAAEPDPYYETESDWLTYMEREKTTPLNKNKGVFAEKEERSLNKRPSVFDETAIFRTGGTENP